MRCVLLLLMVGFAQAELLPGVDPSVPRPTPVPSIPKRSAGEAVAVVEDPLVVENLSLIRLEGWDEGDAFRRISPRLEVDTGLVLPAPQKLSRRLERFGGRPLRESELWTIGDIILSHYDDQGYPVVGVEVLEDGLGESQVSFIVEVGRLGKVGVTSPRFGSPEAVRLGLRLEEGAVLRRSDLDDQLAWYGRSVFRRPRLYVSPGDEPATADVLIGLEEARPWRVTAGYENSGPALLGEDRFLVGAAGMTRNEHIMAWQTVLGMPFSSLNAHALNWEIPIHQYHQSLRLGAAFARLETRSLSNGLVVDNSGTSWSTSIAHDIRLPSWKGWRHGFAYGVEVKGTDQFVLFGAGSFSPGEVRFAHGKIAYDGSRSWENGAIGLQGSIIGSPGGLIPGNDDADFKAYDPAADSAYALARLAGQGWWSPGGDWRIGIRGELQVADSRLLPAEQFSAGGYQTVRGVPEREYFADQGYQSSIEVLSPAWRPIDGVNLRFLGFFDHASLRNRGGGSESLSGSGVGLRMRYGSWLDLRLDHGWRLDASGQQTHVGVRFSY